MTFSLLKPLDGLILNVAGGVQFLWHDGPAGLRHRVVVPKLLVRIPKASPFMGLRPQPLQVVTPALDPMPRDHVDMSEPVVGVRELESFIGLIMFGTFEI